MGLHESCTKWISSYLSDRTQITKFDNMESDKEKVLSGVPQGSILGPILFIIFTSDLSKEVADCRFAAYADDAVLLVSAKTPKQLKTKIETSITAVQDWYTKNGLLINSDKTEFMIVKQRDKMDISIRNGKDLITIQSKDCLRILGIKVDAQLAPRPIPVDSATLQLTWRNHISQIRSRTTNVIRHIARCNNTLSLPSRIILNNALVVPHFNYGDIIYDGCTADARDNLERNHNYAAKALLGQTKYSSATKALQKLNWIPLHQRRKVHQGVFIHKALHHQSSFHATTSISGLIPQHKYQTRSKLDKRFNSTQHSTASTEKSVLYRSTHEWNSIPRHIRSIETTKVFKDKLQRYYIDKFQDDSIHVGKPQ